MAAKRPKDAATTVGYRRARSLARRLAVQALYQLQLNPRSLADTQKQFETDPESDRARPGHEGMRRTREARPHGVRARRAP